MSTVARVLAISLIIYLNFKILLLVSEQSSIFKSFLNFLSVSCTQLQFYIRCILSRALSYTTQQTGSGFAPTPTLEGSEMRRRTVLFPLRRATTAKVTHCSCCNTHLKKKGSL